MRYTDILAAISDYIAQAGVTPAIERHMAAEQRGDTVAKLAAWEVLTREERVIVGRAYVLATRCENTA